MAKDAKIGSLIGLVLIFIVAFVINGFTRSGNRKDRGEPSTTPTDAMSDTDTSELDVSHGPSPPITEWTENPQPTEDKRDTDVYGPPPVTDPAIPESIPEEDSDVSEPGVEKPFFSEVYYAVSEGDNLADIAKKFYGPEEGNKRANVLRIFLVNQKVLTSPHEIFVGQKLVIPPLNGLEPDGSETESILDTPMFEAVRSIGRRHLSSHKRSVNRRQLYAVQEGDSLWSIASTFLGDGSRYKDISKLNGGVLEDEDRLPVGLRLRIPIQ